MPPYGLPDNQTQSGIKSRSTKGGAPDNFNEIRFEDKKGEEDLRIQAEKNYTTLVKNDQTTDILKHRVTNIGISDTLNVTGNISVSIGKPNEPPRTSKMNVTGKHSLDASDTIDIQAPTHIKLTVGGSSIMITPGGIVISAGGGASVSIDSTMIAKAAGGAQVKLDADMTGKSNLGALLTLDANAYLKGKGGSVLIDDNVLAKSSAGSKLLLDGGTATLEADKFIGTGKTEASLASGSSSLKLTPATADIAAAKTNVNGTGMVSIAAPLVKIN